MLRGNMAAVDPSRSLGLARRRLPCSIPLQSTERPRSWIPLAAILAATFLYLTANRSADLSPWPFLLSLVFLGLPHGAVDGLLLIRGKRSRRRLRILLVYLGLFGLSATLLLYMPTATIIAFLLLSVAHFGLADAEIDLPEEATLLKKRLWALSRGLLVIGLPLALSPSLAWAPFFRLTSLLGGTTSFTEEALRFAGMLATGLAVVAGSACAFGNHAERPRRQAWLETAALTLLLSVTHPLFAVGVYFLALHAFRQCDLLGRKLDPANGSGSLGLRLFRTHVASLPLLIPSWLLLGAAVYWLNVRGPYDVAILGIGLYIVGTLPHHWLHNDAEAS